MTNYNPDAKLAEQQKADKRKDNLDTIDSLFKDEGFLTSWEISFLTNIERQLKNRSSLSEKQQKCLDDIAKKAIERLD